MDRVCRFRVTNTKCCKDSRVLTADANGFQKLHGREGAQLLSSTTQCENDLLNQRI
jgi:hypothetical protein